MKTTKLQNSTSTFELLIHFPDGTQSSHLLTKERTLIGNDSRCDIQLNNPTISNIHACLALHSDERLEIIDLASKNGVFVNSQKVSQTSLFEGDILQLASISIHIQESFTNNIEKEAVEEVSSPAHIMVSRPTEGLILIDDEYCDIVFDDDLKYRSLLIEESFSRDFIPTDLEEDQSCELQVTENPLMAIKFITAFNGQILSLDYRPLEEGSYSFSRKKESKTTLLLDGLPFADKTQIAEVRSHELLPREIEGFELIANHKKLIYHKNSLSLQIEICQAPPHLKNAPFFEQDRAFLKDSAKIFAPFLLLALVLLSIDLTPPEEPEKIAVIYKVAKKPNPSKQVSQVKGPQEKETGANQAKQQNKKVETPKKSQTKKIAKKSPPKKTAPAKKKRSFKLNINSNLKMLASKTSSKLNIKTNSQSRAPASTQVSLSGVSSSSLSNSQGALSNLDSKMNGAGLNHYGAKGLGSKSGFDNTYAEPKTVVLGSIDPDLLRKILREHLPQFRHCYQQELEENSEELAGILDLKFTISATGKAKKVHIRSKSSPFSKKGIGCMANVLHHIDFPKPKGGGVVDVRQPLNFTSEKYKI